MPEKLKPLDREAKVELVKSLAIDYPGSKPNARIDWEAAFAARPELKSVLHVRNTGDRQRLYAFASAVFRRAGLPSTGAPPTHPALVPLPSSSSQVQLSPFSRPDGGGGVGGDRKFQYNEEQKQILDQIAREYSGVKSGKSGKKRIRWVAAFQDHPEWKVKLNVDGSSADKTRRQRYFKIGGKGGKKKNSAAAANGDETAAPPAVVVALGCKHCPECGYYLGMHNQAAVETYKLQTTNGNGTSH